MELVSRCVECGLAEPESLASLGGSAPGVVDGILSPSNEKKGYWVGFADNPGDRLTWRILTEDTQKIIICSGIRSALRTTTNQHHASPSGEGTTLPFPIPYPQ